MNKRPARTKKVTPRAIRPKRQIGRSQAPLVDVLEEDLAQYLGRAGDRTLTDDDKLDEDMRRIARNSTMNEIGKKPEVTVIVSRLS